MPDGLVMFSSIDVLLQCHHAETALGTAAVFEAFVCVSLVGFPLVAKFQLHAMASPTALRRKAHALTWTFVSVTLVSLVLIVVFQQTARHFRIASVMASVLEITNASVTLGMEVQTAAHFHVHP